MKENEFEWVLCPNCKHKLFKVYDGKSLDGIEIKCSSCKNIVRINGGIKVEGNKNINRKSN